VVLGGVTATVAKRTWRPAAVVFDCDGLLLDTESRWTLGERAALEAWGGVWVPSFKQRLLGRPLPEAAAVIAAEAGAPPAEVPRIAAALEAAFLDALREYGCEAMPGAAELARALRRGGVPIALASNSRQGQVRAALEAAGLAEVFDVVVCVGDDDGGREIPPKPAPEVYLRACALLDVPPADAVALEDSQTGVDAGRRAGLRVIGVPSLPGQTLEADVVVPSLAAVSVDEDTRKLSWEGV
jgi:HAD superfamily hydrolase (TIGR01509 family)